MIKIIIPIRCFSCGKPVAHLWEEYSKRLERGEDKKKILTALSIKKQCCRTLFLTHVDLIDLAAQYKKV